MCRTAHSGLDFTPVREAVPVAVQPLAASCRGRRKPSTRYTDSNLNPSPQRFIRPEDGDGKCAVQINVDVSHRQLNSLRRDSPACGEL